MRTETELFIVSSCLVTDLIPDTRTAGCYVSLATTRRAPGSLPRASQIAESPGRAKLIVAPAKSFEIGQPFLAASASSRNFAVSIPGT